MQELLSYYGLTDCYEEIRRWYDGYRFGSNGVYCPWDVLNYCDLLRANPERKPENYWINTSGNDVIKRFVAMADDKTREEIETLVAGGTIEKDIREDLTYSEIYNTTTTLICMMTVWKSSLPVGCMKGNPFRNSDLKKLILYEGIR